MHPAHVPLEPEPEPADVRGARDHRPRRRLLGDGHRRRVVPVDDLVELPDEGDRLQVLVAPVAVRQPLARLLRVVEVEHRGDRVHPEPVQVVAREPVERVADEVVGDLVAAVVEDQRPPVRLLAPARVRVLVEVGAVEVDETVGVAREVSRHPVEDDADPAAVERVHEGHEVLRRPVPAGRREGADLLVAPRSVEGVLADRQELHVGVAQVADVVPERLAELPVGEEPVALLGDAPPGAQVDLVDRDGRVERVPARALGRPGLVAPGVPVERGHDRGGARLLDLELEGEGIRLQGEERPVLPQDLELVAAPLAEPGNEELPDAGARMAPHRVPAAVPAVEVAHDAHAAGVRRPHGEHHARHAVEDGRVGAELLVGLVVRALAEEQAVEVRQRRREPVRVLDLPDAPRRVGDREADTGRARRVRGTSPRRSRPDADAPSREEAMPGSAGTDLGPDRPREERADRDRRRSALAADVGTQDGERIRMPPRHQGLHVGGRQGAANRRWARHCICGLYAGRRCGGRGYTTFDGPLDIRARRIRAGLRRPASRTGGASNPGSGCSSARRESRPAERPAMTRRRPPPPRRRGHRPRAGRAHPDGRQAVGGLLRHPVRAHGRGPPGRARLPPGRHGGPGLAQAEPRRARAAVPPDRRQGLRPRLPPRHPAGPLRRGARGRGGGQARRRRNVPGQHDHGEALRGVPGAGGGRAGPRGAPPDPPLRRHGASGAPR